MVLVVGMRGGASNRSILPMPARLASTGLTPAASTVLVLCACVRLALAIDRGPLRAGDTNDYLAGFTLVGPKPATVTLVYWALGGRDWLIVVGQALLGCVCWSVLAVTFWRVMGESRW